MSSCVKTPQSLGGLSAHPGETEATPFPRAACSSFVVTTALAMWFGFVPLQGDFAPQGGEYAPVGAWLGDQAFSSLSLNAQGGISLGTTTPRTVRDWGLGRGAWKAA
jgi:hypothetical protein